MPWFSFLPIKSRLAPLSWSSRTSPFLHQPTSIKRPSQLSAGFLSTTRSLQRHTCPALNTVHSCHAPPLLSIISSCVPTSSQHYPSAHPTLISSHQPSQHPLRQTQRSDNWWVCPQRIVLSPCLSVYSVMCLSLSWAPHKSSARAYRRADACLSGSSTPVVLIGVETGSRSRYQIISYPPVIPHVQSLSLTLELQVIERFPTVFLPPTEARTCCWTGRCRRTDGMRLGLRTVG